MKNIAVFLGANKGRVPHLSTAVLTIAAGIVSQGKTIIYGGASVGLMGLLATTALDAGGQVQGVITERLKDQEIAHSGLSSLAVVATMQERKQRIMSLADAFVVLPGGLGTLEESIEVWNAKKIGEHNKPILFLNLNNFYCTLFEFLSFTVENELLTQEQFDLVEFFETPADLLKRLSEL